MVGDWLLVSKKDQGNCELYAQTLAHSPNGRFVTRCGDEEYIVYPALDSKHTMFGSVDKLM